MFSFTCSYKSVQTAVITPSSHSYTTVNILSDLWIHELLQGTILETSNISEKPQVRCPDYIPSSLL